MNRARWQMCGLAALSTSGSVAILWATWLFYEDRLRTPGIDRIIWIQPLLLALASALGIVAAVLLAAGRPSGHEVLKLAIGILPILLVIRLVSVVLWGGGRLVRSITDGGVPLLIDTIGDRLRVNPAVAVLNIALIVAVIVIATLSKGGKAADSPDTQSTR